MLNRTTDPDICVIYGANHRPERMEGMKQQRYNALIEKLKRINCEIDDALDCIPESAIDAPGGSREPDLDKLAEEVRDAVTMLHSVKDFYTTKTHCELLVQWWYDDRLRPLLSVLDNALDAFGCIARAYNELFAAPFQAAQEPAATAHSGRSTSAQSQGWTFADWLNWRFSGYQRGDIVPGAGPLTDLAHDCKRIPLPNTPAATKDEIKAAIQQKLTGVLGAEGAIDLAWKMYTETV